MATAKIRTKECCDENYSDESNGSSYKAVENITKFLKAKVDIRPAVGIICGTGLGAVTSILSRTIVIDYKDIPKFPASTVQGHSGQLHFGYVGPVPVVCMKGRFHYYEGYPLWKVTLPVRVMKLLGVTTLIVSNASGGINPSYHVGDIVLIKDHINLVGFSGHNPLRGPNDDKFGIRFIPMNDAYDRELIELAKATAKSLDIKGIQDGVYAGIAGPSFETIAELKALQILGADCVGMSTVHEVIIARHCGIQCLGLSLITNKCVMEYESREKPEHEDNLKVGESREQDINSLVQQFIESLNQSTRLV